MLKQLRNNNPVIPHILRHAISLFGWSDGTSSRWLIVRAVYRRVWSGFISTNIMSIILVIQPFHNKAVRIALPHPFFSTTIITILQPVFHGSCIFFWRFLLVCQRAIFPFGDQTFAIPPSRNFQMGDCAFHRIPNLSYLHVQRVIPCPRPFDISTLDHSRTPFLVLGHIFSSFVVTKVVHDWCAACLAHESK